MILACGCTSASHSLVTPEQRRWECLCDRLDGGRNGDGQAAEAPILDEGEHEALRRAADRVRHSVVHVRTVISRPSEGALVPFPVRESRGRRPTGAEDGPARWNPRETNALERALEEGVLTVSEPSGGTGVIVGPDGLILTNGHVVRDAVQVSVELADGSWHEVQQVGVDERFDLAVLWINAKNLAAIDTTGQPAELGLPIVAVGCTSDENGLALRPGRITDESASLQSALDPAGERDYGDLVESSAELSPGFSGGPLLDAAGRLIGLNVAISKVNGVPRAYAIPLNEAVRAAILRLTCDDWGVSSDEGRVWGPPEPS
jgi:S1-C subfamily serine protease